MVDMSPERLDVDISIIDTSHRQQRTDETSMGYRIRSGAQQILVVVTRLLVSFVKSGRPDCVHLNTSGSLGLVRDIIVLTICRIAGVRAVLHLRFGRAPEILTNGSQEGRLLRAALSAAAVTLSIDERTHAAVASVVGEERAHLLPNFIETELYIPKLERGSRTVLFVGSVGPSKGIAELVDAWARLKPSGWRLIVLGPPTDSFASPAWQKSLDHSIQIIGPREHADVIREMTKTALLVLPSHTEGFPNVILEAMATGTPVVATSVGAIPSILAGGAGIVVPPRDVGALERALSQAIGDIDLRISMANVALTKVRNVYSAAVVTAAYRRLWVPGGHPH